MAKKSVYAIRANKKLDLYLGFANIKNIYGKLALPAQNIMDFAFFFNSYDDANKFLTEYFNNVIVKDENKKFYNINNVYVDEEFTDSNIFMYNVPCYFSKHNFNLWKINPDKYKIVP